MPQKTKIRKYTRKCPKSNRSIGVLGENFVTDVLTDAFDCEVLPYSGTVKAFDLLCVIYENDESYAFMVQVKAQYEGRYTKDRSALTASVKDEKLQWLISLPLPTYVAGVDYSGDAMYLAPAFDVNVKFKSIPVKYKFERHKFDYADLLKEDVKEYWHSINIKQHKSTYKSKLV